MMRVVVPLLVVALACAARSEPRERVSPPTPTAPADAPAPPTDAAVDAPELVPMDAPADAPDRPMTPRYVYPILEIKQEGSGSVLTIGAGTRLGVNKSWKAYLVQKDGTRLPRGELTITSVGEHSTRATSTRPVDVLRAPGLQAHLAP